MGRLIHLVKRFFGSLSPIPLAAQDRQWIEARLTDAEVGLWNRMGRADQKHAAQVARDADAALGGADDAVVAAAALHDIGKIVVRFGPVLRAVATVLAAGLGRTRVGRWAGDLDEAATVARASGPRSFSLRQRFGCYVQHEEIGARMLADAGSDPMTVAWAREHYLPRDAWTVPLVVGDALAAADAD